VTKLITLLFIGVWTGVTVPISLSIVFTVLKPIVIKDQSGVSMIIIAIIVALLNVYIGAKIYEKKIEPLLKKGKEKRKFP
jgi:uncharacterized membrane protein (DUF106 family)